MSTDDWLRGGGEMEKLVRSKDWSRTPLGPIESWPQSLRTTISLALASNFPISIAWGPQRTQIYNDGYWPICGGKHPESMGQDFKECWFSAWPAIGDAFETAVGGKTAFLENQRMFLDRHGYLEETFFTFSFSPIRDESGEVAGLFHPVTEMTQQTLSERRLKTLKDLADRTSEAKSVESASRSIIETLSVCELDLPFALVYLLNEDGTRATLAGSAGLEEGGPACPTSVDLTTSEAVGWPMAEAARERQIVEIGDLGTRVGLPHCGPYPERPQAAFILPINISGLEHAFGLLVAGVSARRALDTPYRTFYLLLRDAVINALTSARSYEEERRRSEALAEIDRAKTLFFSNVSHEFRTPLTLMLGPIEDILAKPTDEVWPENRELLDMVNRNGMRLLRLVNTLLDFSRIEAGRAQASYEPTDLATFTAELASNFRSACERAGLELVVDCPPLAEPVYVDRDMWEKIVLNLLSNAFKFTFAGQIRVALTQVGKNAELHVMDTGTGIPAEQMPRLFERFHRVEHARSRTHEGSGIGLALVHELVKLHGGSIIARSAIDEGTTFSVSIPLGTSHLPRERIEAVRTLASTATGAGPYVEEALRWLPDHEETRETKEVLSHYEPSPGAPTFEFESGECPRVLVADDNADMREYLRRLLLKQGYEVIAVSDGPAALAAIREQSPALVLSDVMMPGLDGFGLLRELRADPSTSKIPVLMLSARAGEESRVEGITAGADDYLIKPFSARELVARVRSHLQLATVRSNADRRFREIIDALPAAIYTTDAEGRLTHFNQAAVDFSGRVPELGTDQWCVTWKLYNADGTPLPHDQCPMATALKEGRPVRPVEVIAERPDGTRVWFTPYPTPLRDADGRVGGGINMLIDITERKEAEELRRRDLERSRLLSEALQALLGAQDPDRIAKDLFVRVSAHLDVDTFFNYMVQEDGEALHLHARAGIPEETARSIERLEFGQAICGTVAQTREPIVATDIQHSNYDKAALVRSFGIQCYACNPLMIGGRLLGTLSFASRTRTRFEQDELEFIRTVSQFAAVGIDRLVREEALRKSEELYRRTLSLLPVAVYSCDAAGRITYYNEQSARLWGRTPEIGDTDERFCGSEQMMRPDGTRLPHDRCPMAVALRDGRSFRDEEVIIRRPDGSAVPVLVNTDPIRNGQGEVTGAINAFHDISAIRRAEVALRESEERFRAFTNATSEVVYCMSPDWTELRHLQGREFIADTIEPSRTWIDRYIHPDDQRQVTEAIARAIEAKSIFELEHRVIRVDGSLGWTYSRAIPILDSRGEIVEWFGAASDVTKRKDAEEALRRNAETFAELVEQSPLGIYTVDSQFRIANVSAGSMPAFRNVDPLIGRDFAEVMHILWPEPFASEAIRVFRHTLETGEPYKSPGLTEKRKDIGAIESYEWQINRVTLADGQYGVVCYYFDVTRLQQAAQALRESEERFRMLADNMDQLAWTCNELGNANWYNQRWLDYTGSTFEEMRDWGWTRVQHPDHVERVKESVTRSRNSGEIWEDTFPLRGADGQYRWFLSRAVPIRDESGKIVRWFGTNTDITEQRGAEEALRQADRRKDEFLATLAHELRNPLAPIRAGLELMKMAKDDPATVEEIRTTMERQTQQLIALVDDLLDVSRITQGKLELRKCRVELSEVVQSAVEASKPFIDEAGHELIVTLDDGSIALEADPNRLAQVLSNLLNNSAKYTPEGGRIRLTTQREGSEVVITVKDNGIGIPADMLDRIFEMFAQVDRPLERGYTGLGIGLTLVKSLVEMHGGSVSVRVEGLNQGSEFSIRLPILTRKRRPGTRSRPTAETAAARNKLRVLVVDDNKAAAEMLGMVVKMLGNDVRTAHDGEQAIEVAGEFLPQAILMDLGMPRMNGFEAARRIRGQPWGKQIMLVALTGWGQDEDKQRTKSAGFDHHLVKPAEPAELQSLFATVSGDSDW